MADNRCFSPAMAYCERYYTSEKKAKKNDNKIINKIDKNVAKRVLLRKYSTQFYNSVPVQLTSVLELAGVHREER
jgi:hypothetical protein